MAAAFQFSGVTGFTLRELTSFPAKERSSIADKVSKIERKIFPSIEHFNYDVELKKKNIGLIVASREDNTDDVVAYLVYQRMKRLVWLHKLGVVEQEREKGLGKGLIQCLCDRMERGGCESIYLWVDENRKAARALYTACHFQQVEYRVDYYAEGRSGLKLELALVK